MERISASILPLDCVKCVNLSGVRGNTSSIAPVSASWGNCLVSAPDHSFKGQAVPIVPYPNVLEARDWLCRAFGFEPLDVTTGPDGQAVFAQVLYGDSLIILSRSESSPTEGSGDERCYLMVDNIDTHFSRAIDGGAMVVAPIEETDQGRSYSCRDFSGHAWAFGTFDPRAVKPALPLDTMSVWVRGAVAASAALAIAFASALGGAFLFTNAWSEIEAALIATNSAKSQRDQALEQSTQSLRTAELMKAELIAERAARGAAETRQKALAGDLQRATKSRKQLEKSLATSQQKLGKERDAHENAARVARDLKTKVSKLERTVTSTDRTLQMKLKALQVKLETYKSLEEALQVANSSLKEERGNRDQDRKTIRSLEVELTRASEALRKATDDLAETRAKLETEAARRRVAENSLNSAIAALKERAGKAVVSPPSPVPAQRARADTVGSGER